MSTALTITQKMANLDKFAAENNIALLTKDTGAFSQAIAVAGAMNQLRTMIDDEVIKAFMPLQGSALGFKTDKDTTGGYKEDVVKEVMIEATLKGAQMVGNQVNIIGSRFYATLQFFENYFKVTAKGRVTDLRLDPGIPKTTADGTIVTYKASWKLDGVADSIERVIPIRVNAGMGPDAILGKAKRKILAAIYERITGTTITEGDAEDANSINVDSKIVDAIPVAGLDEDTKAKLKAVLDADADKVNAYLKTLNWIDDGQTYMDVSAKHATTILAKSTEFLKKARG